MSRKHLGRNVDWDNLRAFLALVSTRSSDLAAGQIGVSVATLKRRLARLEDVIGVKLYSGYEDKFTLTNTGEALVLKLYEADHILGQIRPGLAAPKKEERLLVDLWMMDVLFELFFLPFTQQNTDIAPQYHFRAKSGAMPEISQRFNNDITLAHYGSDFSNAESVLVGKHQVGMGATQSYFDTHGIPDRHNLEHHHLALVTDYRLVYGLWSGLENVLVRCASSIETDSTAACHLVGKRGQHFTLITQWSAPDYYQLCVDLPIVELPVYLSFNKAFYGDPRGKRITDRMIETAKTFFKPNPEWTALVVKNG